MDKQRILREAQQLASKYSFWMVSGDITHLYGRAFETRDQKFEVEIKFSNDFPKNPPTFILHENIQSLLGDINLESVKNWTSKSKVITVIDELNQKIKQKLSLDKAIIHEKRETTTEGHFEQKVKDITNLGGESEEFITPDLNAYPPDIPSNNGNRIFDTGDSLFYDSSQESTEFFTPNSKLSNDQFYEGKNYHDIAENTVAINTELVLLQEEYAYDQKGENSAHLMVYLSLTLTKTFIIDINFSKYPNRPIIIFPPELRNLIGDPYTSIELLRKWNIKKPVHIINIFRELEKQLFLIKDIEKEITKITREYRYEQISGSLSKLRVYLLTYGFNEYHLDIDLHPHPDIPLIELDSQLAEIIKIPIDELKTIIDWEKRSSEPIEVIREISWLLDKNSRINFEIELLKEHYKDLKYNPSEEKITIHMNGKMKTESLTFTFEITMPRDYPMSIPQIQVVNEFDIESQEKIKNDLQASFTNFFNEWTPYSYLIDLFNLVSKKIFEVSVVSCVICHKIDCPTCSLRIAGTEEPTCFIECPHCNRPYHKHCWAQTIKSFGKCGFCLKIPPTHMIP
ncbi:MAG: hypothetical protein P8Y70_15270 [Candidatus Lokiarchaeota archaeon]